MSTFIISSCCFIAGVKRYAASVFKKQKYLPSCFVSRVLKLPLFKDLKTQWGHQTDLKNFIWDQKVKYVQIEVVHLLMIKISRKNVGKKMF